MNWWHRLWRRRKLDEQLEKELLFHLDQYTADLIAHGQSPQEARRQATLALGGAEQVKESCRDTRGTRWLEDLWQDLRYALRTLRQRPGFTVIAVLTLGLGIGASTAIFSAVNPILFEPLPYPHAARVTMIWDRLPNMPLVFPAFGTYRELVERSRSFDALAAIKPWEPAITGPSDPERLEGQRVSASYFRVLGVPPALGRNFDSSEDRVHGPAVAMLSYGLWQRRFNGDRAIVGRQIVLDDNLFTVIGVLPRAFENVLAPAAEIWAPLQYDATLPANGREWGHHLRIVGRLRPGIGTAQATRELDGIAHASVPEFHRAPWVLLRYGLLVNPLQDEVTRAVKPALLAVLGAVILVLLIACVNVMNLLLARGAQRRSEFAMRAALGAGRMRLMRQLLTESLLLATFGGALGMFIAQFGVSALVALSPPELPRVNAITIDGTVFAFALGITTAIGLVIGLIPALYAYREDLRQGLRQSSRSTAGGHHRTRGALVVAEVAIALVLLVGAGLLLRSLKTLFAVAPGFDGSRMLTMQVQTASHRLDEDSARYRFFSEALDAVRRVPGVTGAAFTSQLPLSGDQFGAYGVWFEGSAPGSREPAFRYAVSPGYLETMGIPLRRGRFLDAHDRAGAPVVVLINESLAKRKFPAGDAIGRRIHAGPDEGPWATIVGVVGDVKQTSLAVGQEDAFYMSAAQGWFADSSMSLVVRARGDAGALVAAIKRAIWSVDKDQPITRVATMDDLLAASAAERRFALLVFQGFAVVALVLAAMGIYGVLSGSVAERMREIGVRSALGASRGDIVALVVRQAMMLTALGIAIGLCGAVAGSRALDTLLFGISRLDPITYPVVIGLLVGASAIACWVPAWRAARVDPAITLRVE